MGIVKTFVDDGDMFPDDLNDIQEWADARLNTLEAFQAAFQALQAASAFWQAGDIKATGRAVAPDGWLMCDGSAVSRETYSDLWDALRNGGSSSPYGNGDGSNTFSLPDLRGRVPAGADGQAGRLTANDVLGQAGGAEKHVLAGGELPSHTHPDNIAYSAAGGHTHSGAANATVPAPGFVVPTSTNSFSPTAGWSGMGSNNYAAVSVSGTSSFDDLSHTHVLAINGVGNHAHAKSGGVQANTGGGGAHNNMPPYQVVNYMIKT